MRYRKIMIGAVFFWILSGMCLLYYIVMILYAGIHLSFSPAWMIAAAGFAGIGSLCFLQGRGILSIPLGLRIFLWGLFISLILFFAFLEALIVSGMKQTVVSCDAIIVLGAKVREDGSLTSILRYR